MLTKTEAAQKLLALDDVLILCHRNPDGDTLGSGFALARALLNKGRRARVFCHDAVPEKFAYMVPEMPDFEPKTVISVDVADFALFGERTEAQIARYGPVALAIDHHPSHRQFAEELYLEGDSASCCEIIWGLLKERKDEWQLDAAIASCLYTGVATDTGCFKFSNTSPRTHRTAAELMELGADYVSINKVMFDTKTFEDLKLERLALDRLWMSADGKSRRHDHHERADGRGGGGRDRPRRHHRPPPQDRRGRSGHHPQAAGGIRVQGLGPHRRDHLRQRYLRPFRRRRARPGGRLPV